MKAWYDDIDSATLQRIKTYSAFNDAMSKNLMVQTMYEYREKEVQDFKETNHELAETCIARKNRIAELEKENALVKSLLYGTQRTCDNCGFVNCENFQRQRKSEPCSLWCSHRDILTKANKIIKNLLTLSIPIDYAKCPGPLQKIAEAEQFLKEFDNGNNGIA